ncbi:MAG: exo-alpha-sialidase [Simkania sp.]|nr:exo-alpha-sialidase [Simkania sp.]
MRNLQFLFLMIFSVLRASDQTLLVDVFLFSNAPFESCHASTLTETEEGLIVAYFAGSKEGNSDVSIYLSRQCDNKWQAPVKVIEDWGAPTWNPVLFTMPSGKILLFYKAGYDPTRWSGFLTSSIDSGQTWSQPFLLPGGILGPIKNKPLLLQDGRLLCGSSIQSYLNWASSFEWTRDEGLTWERSNPIPYFEERRAPFFPDKKSASKDRPVGVIQPTFWTEDGQHITMLCRSRRIGWICKATSSDGGRTWTRAYPTELPNPDSGFDAVRMFDGRIALVYNHSKTKRTPLNLALSIDGGETWKDVLVLEDGPGSFAYPAIIQTQDGLLHITYTWNRKHIKHIALDPTSL